MAFSGLHPGLTLEPSVTSSSAPDPHNIGGSEHGSDILTNLNALLTDADLIDTGDSRLSDSRTCDNTFDSAVTARSNLDVYSTSETDAKVTGLYDHKGSYDANANSPDLDTSPSGVKKGDAYTVSVAGSFFGTEALEVGDVIIADKDDPTLVTDWTRVNKNISFGTTSGTACEGDDSRLSDDRDPNSHGLGDATRHATATLVQLNALVSDATLIDTGDSRFTDDRDPNSHGLGDATRHATATLAQLNALVSDATLIDTGDSRLSDDRDPNNHASDHTDGTDDVADLVGDTGSGGTHGLAPAPGAGDAAADKFLKSNGSWVDPLTVPDGRDIVLDTTTGSKIGTATSQKLGFYNATPVVQQNGTGETAGFVAGSGTAANDDSTFTGNVGSTAYRISDIVKALKNLGLIAQ